jgi:hypothetical protein
MEQPPPGKPNFRVPIFPQTYEDVQRVKRQRQALRDSLAAREPLPSPPPARLTCRQRAAALFITLWRG